MYNFEFKNPTKIIFGKGQIAKLKNEIPIDKKVLLLYGGGSIFENGVHQKVSDALSRHQVIEFGGITANPEYEVLLEALKLIKSEKINFLLAVGGGSVIDGTKFLSAAAHYKGDCPWDILRKSLRTKEGAAMPFASVLTLPATGSEMNSGAVISRKETKEKLGMGGEGLFPQFSILDPEVVRSIPNRQRVNGLIDAYTHILEQYLTFPVGGDINDRLCEALLLNLHDLTPKLFDQEFDYTTAANFMWSCTWALNGLLQKGVPTDWALHAMGHELTALFGIDHARTLAIVAPHHYRYLLNDKQEKLAQYAERIWKITQGTTQEKALKGIEKLNDFFENLGVETKLSAYTEQDYSNVGEWVERVFTQRRWLALGEHKKLTPQDARKIMEQLL